jgi:hypothetical protein
VILPETRPIDDPISLQRWQQKLLLLAQNLLGPRDITKKIYLPIFHDNGPHLRNTPNLDGAFAELSRNAENYWPTTIYELAHETVHLLDPTIDCTNWLEEGIAVEFSIYVQLKYGFAEIQKPNPGPYLEALEMVRMLPGETFSAAKSVRALAGAFNKVTYQNLHHLFNEMKPTLLQKLAETCVPR